MKDSALVNCNNMLNRELILIPDSSRELLLTIFHRGLRR